MEEMVNESIENTAPSSPNVEAAWERQVDELELDTETDSRLRAMLRRWNPREVPEEALRLMARGMAPAPEAAAEEEEEAQQPAFPLYRRRSIWD